MSDLLKEGFPPGLVDFTFGYALTDPQAELADSVGAETDLRSVAFRSVLGRLTLAREAAALEAAQNGGTFDEATWFPDGNLITAIHAEHRADRQYLRMHDGLVAFRRGLDVEADRPVVLRGYQLDTLDASIRYLGSNQAQVEEGEGSFVKLPTGSGKSLLIASVTKAVKSREDPKDPIRVLITAPTNATIDELYGADGEDGFGKYAPELEVGRFNMYHKELDRQVVLANRSSLQTLLEKDPTALDSFDLIILDEVHKYLGEKIMEIIRKLRKPKLGFTATDKYSYDKRVANLLPEELISLNAREMIENGTLSPVQLWVCKTNEVIFDDGMSDDYDEKEIERISRLETRHRVGRDIALSLVADQRTGAVTCNTIDEADRMAAELHGTVVVLADGSEHTVRATAVHSKTKNQHHIFRQLRSGLLDVVTIVGIDEGWNVPSASFLVNMRPTRSVLRAMQRAGRILRSYTDNQGRRVTAQLVDLVDITQLKRIKTRKSIEQQVEEMAAAAMTEDDVFEPDISVPLVENDASYRLQGCITVPQLFGEDVYQPGKLIASTANHVPRRDFTLEQFPLRSRWALTMTGGTAVELLSYYGMSPNKEQAPDLYLTAVEAARGLGITVTKLRASAAIAGVNFNGNGPYYDQKAIDTIAERLLQRQEPIFL